MLTVDRGENNGQNAAYMQEVARAAARVNGTPALRRFRDVILGNWPDENKRYSRDVSVWRWIAAASDLALTRWAVSIIKAENDRAIAALDALDARDRAMETRRDAH